MCWAEGPALKFYTRHPTTPFLQEQGLSIERYAGQEAQHSIITQGNQLRHFCNNKECQLKNMLGRRPSTQLLHKAPNYDTFATTTTQAIQLQHFCNNNDCPLINVLGRRPSTQLLHKAPNYDIFATTRSVN